MPSVNAIVLDPLDSRILLALDDDPDATVLALSRALGIARNTVHARLARMRAQGALKAFSRRVSVHALGYPLTAFVSLAVQQRDAAATHDALVELPEVVEMHAITGDYDVLLKLVARDTSHLHRLTHRILGIEGVQRSSTTISLEELMPTRLSKLLEAAVGAADTSRTTGPLSTP